MPNPATSKKTMLLFAAAAAAVGAAALFAPAVQEPAPATAPSSASTQPAVGAPRGALTKEQAMGALMALPELKAWSERLEKSSGGTVRGALIEYDQQPKVVKGTSYWQFSFVENGSEAAHRWESFLIAENGAVLVEDLASDQQLSLAQWRKEKRPMERSAPE